MLSVPMASVQAHSLVNSPAGVPLLAAAFIHDHTKRLISLVFASTGALAAFGAIGAWLGGANKLFPAVRVLLGGWAAMGITYGFGRLFALADKSG